MPHKHKRKRDDKDASNFDLPPTSRARTLPAKKQETVFTSEPPTKKREHKRKKPDKDDTPKAFARLMAFQTTGKRGPSGLDNGDRPKKRKTKINKPTTDATTTTTATPAPTTTTSQKTLQIMPGERLSEFNARVDQSLPLTSIPKHRTRTPQIAGLEKVKAPLTKHNKRLARLQSEWRNTEAKLRAKREEEQDELADDKEEDDLLWLGAGIDKAAGGGGKKKRKLAKDDVDPWKQLEKKRREEGDLGRQKNLQDVVMAPPVLKSVKNIFKDKTTPNGGMSRAIMT
ncbi:hypothetical protein LTR10_020809 [Elasticomyces elasticus]|uniref:Ribosome biogenesis protein SLX9 n=1 Tax=Exophiala sideris TaxID=1016849 RepID=A0ABR0JHT8_9EURO|nr:hypothetical protein LTR10_020809 [Elasticomyces elasticus]KAK5034091.1 hypothetical protein LTS07_003011 [Exophiala sideris]KAK5042387.1 hypothetical protein LTR13_001234 [Exophiala sideris]KAK5065468.1 hypothetical protein LTR69_003017 [Exophiala sideris]KAK5186072.1 hypothetical protein LTR44_002121 [Eurotiomycetes sp. CCFEE 6388]